MLRHSHLTRALETGHARSLPTYTRCTWGQSWGWPGCGLGWAPAATPNNAYLTEHQRDEPSNSQPTDMTDTQNGHTHTTQSRHQLDQGSVQGHSTVRSDCAKRIAERKTHSHMKKQLLK